jgi:short-subunit dehydrogenase
MTNQKNILITGCSTGIGYFCAHELQKKGYRVFATARQMKDVERLKSEGLEALQLDLNDSASIQNAVDHILKETDNQLYALFNNGAYGQAGAVEDLSRDALRQQFETNVFGWLELTNLLLPSMRQNGFGRIIQNSSVLGIIALRYRGAYNSSKFAIEGLSDTLRLELKGTGIHISLIEPGPITSAFRKNCLVKLKANIDIEKSYHKKAYDDSIARLTKVGPAAPFTLGPDAVCEKLLHALESRKPKARYAVTFPTHLFGFLKRILPTSLLDRFLIKASEKIPEERL